VTSRRTCVGVGLHLLDRRLHLRPVAVAAGDLPHPCQPFVEKRRTVSRVLVSSLELRGEAVLKEAVCLGRPTLATIPASRIFAQGSWSRRALLLVESRAIHPIVAEKTQEVMSPRGLCRHPTAVHHYSPPALMIPTHDSVLPTNPVHQQRRRRRTTLKGHAHEMTWCRITSISINKHPPFRILQLFISPPRLMYASSGRVACADRAVDLRGPVVSPATKPPSAAAPPIAPLLAGRGGASEVSGD
jgi:hypothetical protein